MNGKYLTNVLVFLMFWVSLSCTSSRDNQEDLPSGQSPETLTRRRDDGSMSSINQVDENHMVHGIRVTFYGDGKAIRLRRSFNHGIRNGPSIRYYQNGQISEHINFKEGEKHGPARKYYRNGALMAELEYDNGFVLPGLKEYNEEGDLVVSYPDMCFREVNMLASKNWVDLVISSTPKRGEIKYFLLRKDEGSTSRVYLITEDGSASLRYYVKPGDSFTETIDILSETTTNLGNILTRKHTYHLHVHNPG